MSTEMASSPANFGRNSAGTGKERTSVDLSLFLKRLFKERNSMLLVSNTFTVPASPAAFPARRTKRERAASLNPGTRLRAMINIRVLNINRGHPRPPVKQLFILRWRERGLAEPEAVARQSFRYPASWTPAKRVGLPQFDSCARHKHG